METQRLQARFEDLCDRLDIPQDDRARHSRRELFDELTAWYSQSHRDPRNLTRLMNCFDLVDAVRTCPPERYAALVDSQYDLLELALWFANAAFIPGSRRDGKALCVERLRYGIAKLSPPPATLERLDAWTFVLVQATGPRRFSTHPLVMLMMEIDLEHFGEERVPAGEDLEVRACRTVAAA